ncbi:MAG: pilus assembly protein [Planctomycetales bacterium]|nr:pilus assembly protein [Planctomycetales bacterium]
MAPPPKTKRSRRGAAVVEFAVCLPLVVLLMLGMIELGRGVMVQHTMQEAAQAGCRVYSARDTTIDQAEAVISEAMTRAGISNYAVTYDPPTKAAMNVHLAPVTVSISVAYADVAWVTPNYLMGASVDGRCILPADVD